MWDSAGRVHQFRFEFDTYVRMKKNRNKLTTKVVFSDETTFRI